MKLKLIISVLSLLYLLFSFEINAQCAGNGELKICVENPTSNKFKLQFTTNEYSWNFSNNKIYPVQNYERLSEDILTGNYRFDAPNDKTAGIDSILWGEFNFTIISLDNNNNEVFRREFTLDLGDENWSKGTTYSDFQRDTWILINQGEEKIYLRGFDPVGNEIKTEINTGGSFSIWTFLKISAPPKK